MTEETPNVNAVFERFADRWPELGDRLLSPT